MHQERHMVTVDSITMELEEARRMALDTTQPSAAITASMGKAKLHGLIVEKAEIAGKDGGPVRFTLALGDAKGN
jgi:phage terminase small subunit